MITLAEMLTALLLEGGAERVLTNIAMAFENAGMKDCGGEEYRKEILDIATSIYNLRNGTRHGPVIEFDLCKAVRFRLEELEKEPDSERKFGRQDAYRIVLALCGEVL